MGWGMIGSYRSWGVRAAGHMVMGGPHREEEGVTEQEGTDASFPMWQLEFTVLEIPGETRGLTSLQTPPLSRYQR